jgi:anti-anti-sigma factor
MTPVRVREQLPPAPVGFGVAFLREQDRHVVTLSGELDVAAATWFDEHVAPAHSRGLRARRTVVDCAGVTFIDAAGLRLVLRLLEPPHSRLANVPEAVARLFRLVGLGLQLDGSGHATHETPSRTSRDG